MNNLFNTSARSVKWSILSFIIPKIINPIVMIILARILNPDNFGILSSALIVISFIQMIWDSGLSKNIIQSDNDKPELKNMTFWLSLSLGILLYLIIFFISPFLSFLNKSDLTIWVLRILSFQIIILSFSTVQEALVIKNIDFRTVFIIKTFSAIITGIVSIIFAFSLLNVWSIVIGNLVGAIFNTLMFWKLSKWQPTLKINISHIKIILKFGGWILLLNLIAWIINWLDSLLVGKYFGIHDLGIYRTGSLMVGMIFALFTGSIPSLIFSIFSKIKEDKPKILKYFVLINKSLVTLAIPIGLILFFFSKQIVLFFLGSKWVEMSNVISILGISECIGTFVALNPIILQSIGKPDLQPKLGILILPLYILVYTYFIPMGVAYLIYGKLFLTFFTLFFNNYILTKALNIKYFHVFLSFNKTLISALLLSTLFLVYTNILSIFFGTNFLILCYYILFSITIYFISIYLIDKKFLSSFFQLIKHTII